MSHGKQFTLYSHTGGPNGWKVAFVLEELGLTYETVYLKFDKQEQKAPEFTKYNPNGRIPAIIDHYNNDFVLWESVAIMVYLTDKYDPEHKISVSDSDEKYEQLQWLLFQASGQGPYFGQSAWFQFYHKEKVPSAVERYNNEIRRVLGVLDGVLSKQEYLVGGKVTIADLSFIPWNEAASTRILGTDFDFDKEFPAAAKWHKKLRERESVKKLYTVRASLLS
jgi:glutathione S-transferase